ncbi:deoxycytidyl transferase [Coelomomyces lativittatus]|nr:deoxycytidyl transferase [Coelomomyces lativittatus]
MRPNQSELGPSEFGSYFSERKKKLRRQDDDTVNDSPLNPVSNVPDTSSSLFKGMTMHINGFTGGMDHLSLKLLILKHGGKYDHYFSRSSTTHMIASVLTEAKKKMYRHLKVVSPQWVFDCIEHQRILPWELYSTLDSTLATNTSDYLTHYFHRSRLHHLSVWKAELQAFVEGLQGTLTLKSKDPTDIQMIFHVDMDCFFASVALLDRPDLIHMPVGVSHGTTEKSSADIASCNYVARRFGVRNGMMANQAKALCPNLVLLPYTFDKYKLVSEQLYRLLAEHADDLEAVSCDEAFIKVYAKSFDEAMSYANEIREKIFLRTQCPASIGMGENKLLARLATIKAKPNGIFHLTRAKLLNLLHEFKVSHLPGVGPAIARKLEMKQVSDCHELFLMSKSELQKEFGPKTGETLHQMCRGIDNRVFGHKLRKSISVEVNYGIRFTTKKESHDFIRNLSIEVSNRLKLQKFSTRMLTLKIMKRASEAEPRKHLGHGICDTFSKSSHLNKPTQDPDTIFTTLASSLDSFEINCEDLRGIGVTCTLLMSETQNSISNLFLNSTNTNSTLKRDRIPKDHPYKKEDIDRSVLKSLPIQIQQELNDALQLTQSIPPSFSKHGKIPKVSAQQRKVPSIFQIGKNENGTCFLILFLFFSYCFFFLQ